MAIEALIFDVDGTLADTEEAHRTAFNLAFERHGLGWDWSATQYRELLQVTGGKERISSFIASRELDAGERQRLNLLGPTLHAEKNRIYASIVGDGALPLRPGIARLLEEALTSGCRLAIASTTSAVNIDALLRATLGPRGPGLFSVIACGDQVRLKKPAPDIYWLALTELGLAPAQAVAFEDSANGLQAAVDAQLWTVVTPNFWTEDSDFAAANLLLPHLGDPGNPIAGEPGDRLESIAWLSLDELSQFAVRLDSKARLIEPVDQRPASAR